MVSAMISAALRRNTVARVRRLAVALTSTEELLAECQWIGWQGFLDDWASALSASNKDWFWACFSPEAAAALRALDATLTDATARHRTESAAKFVASRRFAMTRPAAVTLVRALDEHPRPLDD